MLCPIAVAELLGMQPQFVPLPSISEQFKVIQTLFPKKTSDEREAFSGYRRLIHSFPAVEENVIATRLIIKLGL